MSDWRLNIIIDPEWRDYRVDFSRGWPARFINSIPRLSRLRPIAFGLLADARAACLTASIPRMMTTQIVKFHSGHIAGKYNSPAIQTANAITRRLAEKVRGQLNLTSEQMAILQGACIELSDELLTASERAEAIRHDAVWNDYLAVSGFRLLVWGSQRSCFVQLYSAFDDFLCRSIAAAKQQPTYFRKGSDDKFIEPLTEFFGENVCKISWTDDYITAVRLARHAIAHHGGRETDKLRTSHHPFAVIDKMLQIRAQDNLRLLNHIQGCADAVVAEASKLPQLTRPRRR